MEELPKYMKRYLSNNHGFTLIEMLLVLYIIIMISSIVYQMTIQITEKRVVDQFFEQLMLDIQSMQVLALKEEEAINIYFRDNNTYKASYDLVGEKIFERTLPKGIEINIYSNLKKITFNPNGNLKNFGKIIFYTPFGETHLVVNIQEGRMRLVEY